MSTQRKIVRSDKNQPEIVAALQRIGATVVDLHKVGGGCPDLLVGFRGANFLLEVKNPKGRNRMEGDQVEFIQTWRGQSAIVRTVDEALAAIMSQVDVTNYRVNTGGD